MESVRRDAAAAAAVVACLVLVVLVAPSAIVQDSWLTLAAGRLVSATGVPHHELLTVWAHGRSWIDQQWLAQLLFYRADALGGIRGVVLLSALLNGAALIGAVALARRRGASGVALLLWVPAIVLAAPWALQARAQSFALPLFISVLALVFADSRRRSPRVFIALPLLALWGNLHGTALLGACIVSLHAFVTIVEDRVAHTLRGRDTARAAVLAAGAFLALAANPYGFGIASYYRTMVIDPPFASLVQEWKPSTLSGTTAPFYVLALMAVVIAARNRRRLTATEAAVGLVLLAAAVDAVRSITWFALTTLVLVPPLLHLRRVPGKRFAAPGRAAVLLGTLLSLVGAVVAFPGSVAAQKHRAWSTRGAAALQAAAARYPAARVLADGRHADFLLWQEPRLVGRLLADVRFEVLTRPELQRLARFEQDPVPQDAMGADLVVLDPKSQPLLPWRTRGWKQLYVDSSIGVFERSQR